MRTITINISDEDYHAMVTHFEQRNLGRPLVAIRSVVEDRETKHAFHPLMRADGEYTKRCQVCSRFESDHMRC
jgi:hypothetical protein